MSYNYHGKYSRFVTLPLQYVHPSVISSHPSCQSLTHSYIFTVSKYVPTNVHLCPITPCHPYQFALTSTVVTEYVSNFCSVHSHLLVLVQNTHYVHTFLMVSWILVFTGIFATCTDHTHLSTHFLSLDTWREVSVCLHYMHLLLLNP